MINEEKAFEHARDIITQINDDLRRLAIKETEDVIRKYRNYPNHTLAPIAWESFVDQCDAFDVDPHENVFADAFPHLFLELV